MLRLEWNLNTDESNVLNSTFFLLCMNKRLFLQYNRNTIEKTSSRFNQPFIAYHDVCKLLVSKFEKSASEMQLAFTCFEDTYLNPVLLVHQPLPILKCVWSYDKHLGMELRLAKRICIAQEINELELLVSSPSSWNAFGHTSNLLSSYQIPYIASTPYDVQEMTERSIK